MPPGVAAEAQAVLAPALPCSCHEASMMKDRSPSYSVPGVPLRFARRVKARWLCRAHTHPRGKRLWLICHFPSSAPPWTPQLVRPAPSHSHFPQGLRCQGGRFRKGFYAAASVPHWLSATILSLFLHSGPWNEGDFNSSEPCPISCSVMKNSWGEGVERMEMGVGILLCTLL